MSELKPRPAAGPVQARAALQSKQEQRKLLALALLLAAFVAVIVKDRQFWFGAEESPDADLIQPAVAPQKPVRVAPRAAAQARPIPAAPRKQAAAATAKASQPKAASSAVVAANRAPLPPLEVEIVAGNSHRMLSPGSNATKVEITHPGLSSSSKPPEFTAKLAVPTNAAEIERLNTGAVQPGVGPSGVSYPLLAQQMKVQGSVVLQALIGADGFIQNLRVLSGPGILTAAAQQAVREWRFKPYLQNGEPVETQAKITVNFTIRVADGSVTTASLNPSPRLVIQMAE
jgi:protein TonB